VNLTSHLHLVPSSRMRGIYLKHVNCAKAFYHDMAHPQVALHFPVIILMLHLS
jgi:hypothetical protein